jgi:putative peptidoglycan lipid II flippase
MQDSKTPMRSALIAVFANLLLNLTLIWFLGRAGLACATAICSYLQVTILVAVLQKRLGRSILDGFLVTLAKTITATVFMYLAGAGIISLMAGLPDSRGYNILRLAVVVPSAAGVYLLAAKFLHIEMLSLLGGGKRPR